MADLAEQGALSFEVGHQHVDWPTNGLQYNFHLPHPDGIWIEAYKRSNGVFEVEMKNYVGGFRTLIGVPLPLPRAGSDEPFTVKAQIGWKKRGKEILLAINGQTVAMTSGQPLDEAPPPSPH